MANLFKKKTTEELSETTVESTRKEMLKDKDENFKFLKLVQAQQFEQAYKLGRAILKTNPNNPSITRFCQFIQQNNAELKKMVDEEREQAEYETDSEEEEDGEDGDEEDEEDQEPESDSVSESQSESESEREASKDKKKSRSPGKLCDINEWPHVCKNENCPNKKK